MATSPAEALAREIADLRRRVRGLERSAATDLRSIDGGSFTAYDDDGTEVVLLGRRPDGSWGVEGVNGGSVVADEARDGAITAAAILDGAVGPEKASFYGEVQQASTDAASAQAAADAASADAAQATADANAALTAVDSKAEIVYSATAPTGAAHVYWVDTTTGRGNRWDGSAWVEIQDEDVQAALSNAATAQQTATDAQSAANAAATAAATAQDRADAAYALADGKVQTYFGTTDPTTVAGQTVGVGDLWFDEGAGNVVKRWSGSAWVALQDAEIQQALDDASAAQAAADGKITTFYGSTTPVAEADGDLWVDPSRGNLVSRWDAVGGTWVALTVDTGAIAPAAITETEILDGSITSPKMEANLVLSTRLISGDPLGARVEQNTTGLYAYGAGGVQTFSVDAATGAVGVTGDLATAPDGQPRVELTDYTTGIESGTQGAAQIRFIPGESVVTDWDTTEPGFVTVWSDTSTGNDGFTMEVVTPDPTNYDRARLRLLSGDVGYSQPSVLTYGELWVYDDFTTPLRLFSVTDTETYLDSDKFYLNLRQASSYFQVDNSQIVWTSGGNDYFWLQNSSFEWKVNNDTNQQWIFVDPDRMVYQTNDVFMSGGHRAKLTGDAGAVFVGYGNNAGDNHHGLMALEGSGSIRILSRSSDPGLEVMNGAGSGWRNIWASAFETHSDRATKTNLRAPEASALDAVRNAPVYAYDYREEFAPDDPTRFGKVGPLAEDLPDGVARTPENHTLYEEPLQVVDLGQMISLLWQAVQELDEELDEYRRGPRPARKERDFTEKPLPTRKPDTIAKTKKENDERAEQRYPDNPRPSRATGPGRRG